MQVKHPRLQQLITDTMMHCTCSLQQRKQNLALGYTHAGEDNTDVTYTITETR